MSWALSATLNHTDGLTLEIDQLKSIDRTNIGNSQCVEERDEQIELAIDAVSHLLDDAAFANAAEIGVTLSGHANPEHKTASGWANEAINISVFVKSYREDKTE
jgi:hypothetical protein